MTPGKSSADRRRGWSGRPSGKMGGPSPPQTGRQTVRENWRTVGCFWRILTKGFVDVGSNKEAYNYWAGLSDSLLLYRTKGFFIIGRGKRILYYHIRLKDSLLMYSGKWSVTLYRQHRQQTVNAGGAADRSKKIVGRPSPETGRQTVRENGGLSDVFGGL